MSRVDELKKVREILSKVDYPTLTNILDSYLPSVPLSIIDFKNEKFDLGQHYAGGSNLLFRARILDEKTHKLYELLQNLSYIPEDKWDKIDKYGRVNKPGESMFYASTEFSTACLETFSKGESMNKFIDKGSLMLAVGTWKIDHPMTFAQMTSPEDYFERFVKEINLDINKITIDSVRKQNEHLRKQIANDDEFQILEFFSEEFAKTDTIDHNEYKLANYYADRVFNRNPKFRIDGDIDGIWYPSVPSCYQETNIVMPPAKVHEKLKFLWADIIWVVHTKKTGHTQFLPIQKRAKVNDKGEIEWRSNK